MVVGVTVIDKEKSDGHEQMRFGGWRWEKMEEDCTDPRSSIPAEQGRRTFFISYV